MKNTAITLLILFLVVIRYSDSYAEKREEYKEVTIQAELVSIKDISQFEGQVITTHFDPSFVISLKLADGTVNHYAVHSLVHTFKGMKYSIGGKYNFIIRHYSDTGRYSIQAE